MKLPVARLSRVAVGKHRLRKRQRDLRDVVHRRARRARARAAASTTFQQVIDAIDAGADLARRMAQQVSAPQIERRVAEPAHRWRRRCGARARARGRRARSGRRATRRARRRASASRAACSPAQRWRAVAACAARGPASSRPGRQHRDPRRRPRSSPIRSGPCSRAARLERRAGHVLHGKPERRARERRRQLGGLQDLQQRRAVVPAERGRRGRPPCRLRAPTCGTKRTSRDAAALGEARGSRRRSAANTSASIADEVHLVDRDDEVRNAEQVGERGVPARLRHARRGAHRPAGSRAAPCCAAVTMLRVYCSWPGRVGDDELARGGGEIAVRDVDRDALLALGARGRRSAATDRAPGRGAATCARSRRAGRRGSPSCRRAAGRSACSCRRRRCPRSGTAARRGRGASRRSIADIRSSLPACAVPSTPRASGRRAASRRAR